MSDDCAKLREERDTLQRMYDATRTREDNLQAVADELAEALRMVLPTYSLAMTLSKQTPEGFEKSADVKLSRAALSRYDALTKKCSGYHPPDAACRICEADALRGKP